MLERSKRDILPPTAGPLSLMPVAVQVIHDALPVSPTLRIDFASVPAVLQLDVLETGPPYLKMHKLTYVVILF